MMIDRRTKKMASQKAVIGLMDKATNKGGTTIMKKPILGTSSEKKVIAPHTQAPGMCMMFRKPTTQAAATLPPIRLTRIHPMIITDDLDKALAALPRFWGRKMDKYSSSSGRGFRTM